MTRMIRAYSSKSMSPLGALLRVRARARARVRVRVGGAVRVGARARTLALALTLRRLGTRPLDHVVHLVRVTARGRGVGVVGRGGGHPNPNPNPNPNRLLDVRVLLDLARCEQRRLELVLLDHPVTWSGLG